MLSILVLVAVMGSEDGCWVGGVSGSVAHGDHDSGVRWSSQEAQRPSERPTRYPSSKPVSFDQDEAIPEPEDGYLDQYGVRDWRHEA